MRCIDDAVRWLQTSGVANIRKQPMKKKEVDWENLQNGQKQPKKNKNDPDIKNPEFREVWSKMKVDMKELRENFEFSHNKQL